MYTLPDGDYGAYLRKSRMDLEAEARGEEDTYAKHERILMDISRRYNIVITHIYREKPATSGERISERPEMLELLEDVEKERWRGILVVEVERLARGDTMDQGIVAQAFKYSNTLIVTPMRIYDPTNPDDEEYFEFGLFMSRREFKTITRRLQGGRLGSVNQGKYVGNKPPYGYNRIRLDKGGFTLDPHPEQAPIVKLIFALYTESEPKKRMGTSLIAKHLNEDLKIPTANNKTWITSTINSIIRNPIYAGYVRWGSRPLVKRRDSKSRPRRSEGQYTLAKGLHPPLIDEVTYKRAQSILKANGHAPAPKGKISNPLAGLVRCDMCGGPMLSRPNDKTPDSLICVTQGCKNVSSYIHIVEERMLEALQVWLDQYKAKWKNKRKQPETPSYHQDIVKQLERKLAELDSQKEELHNLVEKKVYTIETYIERSQSLTKQIEETKTALAKASQELEVEQQRAKAKIEIIPKVETVIKSYKKTKVPAEKNNLLKSVVERAVYRKDVGGRWSGKQDQFKLMLYPRLPEEN